MAGAGPRFASAGRRSRRPMRDVTDEFVEPAVIGGYQG